jgi:hypothetical protein
MGLGISPRGGSFKTPGKTASGATAYTIGIPPYGGSRGVGRPVYSIDDQGYPNWNKGQSGYFIKVNNFFHLAGATAQTMYWLRPLNWSVVAVAGAINTTAFTLADNPGAYSTNFHFPSGKTTAPVLSATGGVVYGAPANVADLTPGSTHYFAVQLADGSWFFDLLAAFNTSTFVVTTTTTIPNVTGGGIPKGAILFLFGTSSTVDPNTGQLPPAEYPVVSVGNSLLGGEDGIITSVHPGDPMMFLNPNGTAASFTGGISGSYVQY